jgi:poly-gamma-glutamate capsule biosynthesis protein CapA/YwtB (metallophosphatase superfamily)
MLGRLIDQMFPQHVNEPDEARIASSFRKSNPQLQNYGPDSPWGTTLPILRAGDLNILNLETSSTTHQTKWPNKVFNYRMHPENIGTLQAANISYAGLANNHTLDFSEPGLLETVKTVKEAGIAFAGAGETANEARRPAVLQLPASDGRSKHDIQIWSASDHPHNWSSVPTFHFIDYTQQTRERLKALLTRLTSKNALKIFSIHWGPNYAWHPAQEIRDLAHFLIDECGIDIIHGHSSHHVQGVEVYKGKLIIYGCGDFVDDYALTPGYRNDLSAIWQVTVEESVDNTGETSLIVKQLKILPTRIERFHAQILDSGDEDFRWVNDTIAKLSREFGTIAYPSSASDSHLSISLS